MSRFSCSCTVILIVCLWLTALPASQCIPIGEATPVLASGADGGVDLHVVNGAYPVYYSVAHTNGRFGKFIRAYGVKEYDQMKDGGAPKATKPADIRK